MSRADDKMLRISGETYDALRAIANETGDTLKAIVARIVKAEHRKYTILNLASTPKVFDDGSQL